MKIESMKMKERLRKRRRKRSTRDIIQVILKTLKATKRRKRKVNTNTKRVVNDIETVVMKTGL